MCAMPSGEYAETRTEQAAEFRFASWAVFRPYAFGLYALALVLWTANYGIPVQRELVILWTCGALACASIGRPPREILQLVLDWLPIVAVLWVYDLTRGAARSLPNGCRTTSTSPASSTGGTSSSPSYTPPTSSSPLRWRGTSGRATGSPSSASPGGW
jgi:hypothetical protein